MNFANTSLGSLDSTNKETNRTAITTTPLSDDLLVTIVWTTLLSYGLVANLLILVGIARSAKMRSATSYWLIVSLAVCDLAMIVISLGHLVPSTYLHDAYVRVDSLRNVVAIFCYDIFWYTGVLTLGLMAINRFVSIVHPMEYKVWFSPRRTRAAIAAMFAGGTAVSLPILTPCCQMKWDHQNWITIYDPADSPHAYADLAVNGATVLVMLYCYARVIQRVRASSVAMAKHRLNLAKTAEPTVSAASSIANLRARLPSVLQSSEQPTTQPPSESSHHNPPAATHVSKRERKLFLQFFIVSLVFLLTWSTWQWLPHLSLSRWIYFTGTSFFFINNAVNPTVYLFFNSSLRREVHRFLCRGNHHDTRRPTPTTAGVSTTGGMAVVAEQEGGRSTSEGLAAGCGLSHVARVHSLRSGASQRRRRPCDGSTKQSRPLLTDRRPSTSSSRSSMSDVGPSTTLFVPSTAPDVVPAAQPLVSRRPQKSFNVVVTIDGEQVATQLSVVRGNKSPRHPSGSLLNDSDTVYTSEKNEASISEGVDKVVVVGISSTTV